MMRRVRFMKRLSKTSSDGRHAQSYGVRVGYWPCLKAPFICVDFHMWRLELWHGLPSHRYTEAK
jgi:hypothetical protein